MILEQRIWSVQIHANLSQFACDAKIRKSKQLITEKPYYFEEFSKKLIFEPHKLLSLGHIVIGKAHLEYSKQNPFKGSKKE